VAPDRARAMVRAIDDDNPGSGISQYEGKVVLAAWGQAEYQTPDFGRWVMLVKIDRDEAYRPIEDLRTLQLGSEALMVVSSILVAFLLARRFTRSILSIEYALLEQLDYQAAHDPLTGLVNRQEFERRAKRLVATAGRDNSEHALCFLDLDQFKVVNDSCGHGAGDELLRRLGKWLRNVIREQDTVARLCGDEFGILLEHCSLEQARLIVDSLHRSIQDYHFNWEGRNFRVGVSIGLVAVSNSMRNLTELLKQADAACYIAKEQGRNRIHVYYPDDVEIAKRHGEMQWVERINRALEEHRFCLYVQPIISLEQKTVHHYELLLRMVDEQGRLVLPGAFLPAAERYNLVTNLDRWVIQKTLSLLARSQQFLESVHFFSINLSGCSITDGQFLEFVLESLRDSCVKGNKICFEITETTAISHLNKADTFISRLRELGCSFALDDFGSGVSSFGYLKNLKVDYLKIDGSFVRDIVNNPIDYAMVKAINEIGKVMNMKTIAEFVENDAIKGMLQAIGVDYAQGYGIGKLQPLEELLGNPEFHYHREAVCEDYPQGHRTR
ncbi:MAG: EAL domain-containing protein, partial [Methylococcales bacterium]